MGDIIKKENNTLVRLFHRDMTTSLGKPFERDILLLETHIAGTSFIKGFSMLEPLLQVDDQLDFFREPKNKIDTHAVLIQDQSGNKLGYLPSNDNLIISRLMDAGKLIFGKVISKKKRGDWNYIEIGVYMKD